MKPFVGLISRDATRIWDYCIFANFVKIVTTLNEIAMIRKILMILLLGVVICSCNKEPGLGGETNSGIFVLDNGKLVDAHDYSVVLKSSGEERVLLIMSLKLSVIEPGKYTLNSELTINGITAIVSSETENHKYNSEGSTIQNSAAFYPVILKAPANSSASERKASFKLRDVSNCSAVIHVSQPKQ